MIKNNEKKLILNPSEQLRLYGYNLKFNIFRQLLINNKIPKCTLLTGQKGIGKSTFAYHLINYFFSLKEKNSYLLEQNEINSENNSFKLINSNIHPNFYLLNNYNLDGYIKIDQVRNLLKFLRNTTFNNNLKIVMIDNVENLNLSSSNALLKCLEEKIDNTFFLLIHNESKNILNTIRSRCVEFKFHLNETEKYNIFTKLSKQYYENIDEKKIFDYFYFETPGNLIKYMSVIDFVEYDVLSNKFNVISGLIDKYIKEENSETLYFLLIYIEKFYKDLFLSNSNKINIFYHNKFRILKLINDMKVYNLDKKNTFLGVKDIIQSDAR